MFFVRIRNSLRDGLMKARIWYLSRIWRHHIHPSARVSFSAYLDKTNPTGISVGEETILTRGVVVLSHDFVRLSYGHTKIGSKCFIGVNTIIMPGVTIGDEVVIGAGSVVTRDIESRTVAIGNPARAIRKIRTQRYGIIIPQDADPIE